MITTKKGNTKFERKFIASENNKKNYSIQN